MCFGTILSSAWLVITTMTTVGYGDCFPITTLGKLVGAFAQISGVIVLALPITVLGSNFQVRPTRTMTACLPTSLPAHQPAT